VANEVSVLITGTTSGVGRALLDHYARSGARVVSVNRRRVPELESAYPTVRFESVDVRATEQVHELLQSLAEAGQLPETFILNAGINQIDNDESFELAAYRTVIDTNLYGVLNFVEPVLKLPRQRVRRHLIAIGSMARYAGNPYGLGYTTSKRALCECFEVWSRMYGGTELVFQQVMLGPIHTAIFTMADEFPPWMVRLKRLFTGSPEATARAISRFARSRRSKLFYPWHAIPLYFGIWLCRVLVPGFWRGQRTLKGAAR
jgi:NAD(P)-dependent dehydrogenase (short-subunit alcohol dehydrogenase family)